MKVAIKAMAKWSIFWYIMGTWHLYSLSHFDYTLSQPENDRDVRAYSGGRRLSPCAQLVCYRTRSKRNTGIDA